MTAPQRLSYEPADELCDKDRRQSHAQHEADSLDHLGRFDAGAIEGREYEQCDGQRKDSKNEHFASSSD